ncbi:hypothetical protein [Streptomyces sp. ERV7]|uniref:hypothetical protein n=1 Tax=Streptomyces sp. ERV7 TaxID=1322334 RepID=UPI00267AC637
MTGHRAGHQDVRVRRAGARPRAGPRPAKAPAGGTARAVHEWRTAGRWVLAAVIAMGLLQGGIWYVGGDGDVDSLRMWQQRMLWLIGINLVIALSYTLFPKKVEAARSRR